MTMKLIQTMTEKELKEYIKNTHGLCIRKVLAIQELERREGKDISEINLDQ